MELFVQEIRAVVIVVLMIVQDGISTLQVVLCIIVEEYSRHR